MFNFTLFDSVKQNLVFSSSKVSTKLPKLKDVLVESASRNVTQTLALMSKLEYANFFAKISVMWGLS